MVDEKEAGKGEDMGAKEEGKKKYCWERRQGKVRYPHKSLWISPHKWSQITQHCTSGPNFSGEEKEKKLETGADNSE